MPIAVSCPGCSAAFTVKDEFAGKRGKCPKCGDPITIPGGAKPATAKPVAARPKPLEVDEPVDDEDAPPPKKKRVAEDDEDERPKANRGRKSAGKAKRDEDDENDRPRKKRWKKKPEPKSNLPLLLGVGGGVLALLVVVGVILAVVLNQPKDTAKPTSNPVPPPPVGPGPGPGPNPPINIDNDKVTAGNLAQLRAGMTLAEVEVVLGAGRKADEIVARQSVAALPDGIDADDRWTPQVRDGRVYQWGNRGTIILVAFSSPPAFGGKVSGVFGQIGSITSEPVKPGGSTTTGELPPLPQGALDDRPVVTLNPDEFARDYKKYADKYVVMSCVAERDFPAGTHLRTMKPFPASGRRVEFAFAGLTDVALKKGDKYEVWGRISSYSAGEKEPISLDNAVLLSPVGKPVSAASVVDEFIADKRKATDKYLAAEPPYFSGVVAGVENGDLLLTSHQAGDRTVKVTVSYAAIVPPPVKVGDTITFSGKVLNYRVPEKGNANHFRFDHCRPPLTYRPPGPPDPITATAPKPFDPKTLTELPTATLTATELAKDPAKYAGKWVVVTGKAKFGTEFRIDKETKKGRRGWEAVQLDQQGVLVRFAGNSPFVETVKTDAEVEVWGRVKGLAADGKAVEVEDCLTLKPCVEITARDLCEEYAKDAKAARTKYEKAALRVTGVVVMRDDRRYLLGAATGEKFREVVCGKALSDPALDIRPGDTVTVIADRPFDLVNSFTLEGVRVFSVTR